MTSSSLINHKKSLHHFKTNDMKKQDLFSVSSTLLAIFGLMQVNISNLFLFMVLVALYTIVMDLIYNACK